MISYTWSIYGEYENLDTRENIIGEINSDLSPSDSPCHGLDTRSTRTEGHVNEPSCHLSHYLSVEQAKTRRLDTDWDLSVSVVFRVNMSIISAPRQNTNVWAPHDVGHAIRLCAWTMLYSTLRSLFLSFLLVTPWVAPSTHLGFNVCLFALLTFADVIPFRSRSP